jgi:PAS domain S-box-containing protein
MAGDRNDQGNGQDVIEKDFLSENVWRVLILASAVAVLLFSIYCLSHGITIIFMHLYYFPIVLLAYRYRYRGFVLATLLAIAYVGLVYFYNLGQADIITGAWYRFIVFVGIAAVVAYLSERLTAALISQKEGSETIQKMQQFQESVITNANVWITVLAPDGTIIVWNDAAEAIGGYKRGEVLGNNRVWKHMYPEKEYRHKVTREIQRVIERDTYLENFETEIRCADGTQKTIVWNTRGIRDPTGTILSYIAIGRDTTEQKRAENALRESENRFRTMADWTYDMEYWTDQNKDFVYISPSVEHITGFSAGEFIADKGLIDRIVHPDDRALWEGHTPLHTGTELSSNSTEIEFRIIAKDGTMRWISHTCRSIFSNDGTWIGRRVSNRDITDRKLAEEALECANIQLKELDQLKSMFIASMSHELRTPLNSIIGFTGILIKGMAGEMNPEQKKQLGMVQDSARHLLGLINDVIDISKIEGGKIEADVSIFNLADVIRELKNTFGLAAQEQGLILNMEIPGPIAVTSDERRIKQIIMNLVSNAIKFTDEGGVDVTVEKKGQVIEIRVRDTGIGIGKEDLEQLFRPFVRVMVPGRLTEGTGLGLYLSKKIARFLGGDITAESELHKGSVFTFSFPIMYKKQEDI